jgi:hypothetical protein
MTINSDSLVFFIIIVIPSSLIGVLRIFQTEILPWKSLII